MGLNTSFGCWDGSYSSFHRWRQKIAEAIGIKLDEMQGFNGNIPWWSLRPDALHILLNHSDCDGDIKWKDAKKIADRLTEILPLLKGDGGGHIGLYQDKTQIFINGLLEAYKAKKNVLFG